jgi:hypothetical protein
MKFTPFKLLYGEEPVTAEEIKLRSARTRTEATYSPSEAESKDLLEPERMKAVENLQCYQNETRAWRDKKVKPKHIEVGDLCCCEAHPQKPQENWNLSGLDPFVWQTTKVGCWNTLGMLTISFVSTFR